MFEVYTYNMNNLNNLYYLVTPLIEVAHARICGTHSDTPPMCFGKFSKFWNQTHFLAGMGTYIYLPDDLFIYDTFLKNKLMASYEGLSFTDGVRSSIIALRKKNKKQRETHLLVEFATKLERCNIFGNIMNDFSFLFPCLKLSVHII